MTCVICKSGQPRPATATATFDREGHTIVIRGVPAQVCPQCGEPYYDEATSARLLELVNLARHAGTTVGVLEYAVA